MKSIQSWASSLIRPRIRQKIVQAGLRIYREQLKKTAFGRWIGQQILKREIITPEEILFRAKPQFDRSMYISKEINQLDIDNDLNVPGFHLSPPLNIKISAELTIRPHINVLLPSLRRRHMSGGPNTALLLAANLVHLGESVRIIAVDAPAEGEENELYPHMDGLFGRPVDRDRIKLIDGFDRTKPIMIGANDVFLATAWWTAQIAKYAIKKTNYDTFIYLIQDFEPVLHEGSTFQARALETYSLPHIPVINTRLLLDHLVKEGSGLYAQTAFANAAFVFEPAIDRNYYFPESKTQDSAGHSKRVLLFYARPTIARRNLFEIGVAALGKAVARGTLDKDLWEIWGMGEKFNPIPLSDGAVLKPLPWMSFNEYAKKVRTSDLLLSLMLSPHPSYPPLEMAASAKLVVTNSFSVKTPDRMQAISPNILVAEPNPDSIAALLDSAAGRVNAGLPSPDPTGTISLPSSWDESLSNIVPRLKERLDVIRSQPVHKVNLSFQDIPTTSMSEYERFRAHRLLARRQDGPYYQTPGLITFVTSAYNTDPAYLEALANCMFLQDGGTEFEWLILDNGSTDEKTIDSLMTIASHPCVHLIKRDRNLGIIGGMRYLLENATGRYIIPMDSDDVIEPDCVNVITRFIHENDFPALVYSDEDKLANGRYDTPYFKPDWDPVLFANSCYIAHLCVIDRQKALQLDLYTDLDAEGSHDWDSFIKFIQAGYKPLHLPEVLYSWRMHAHSTSGNIASKNYITSSHQAVLNRYLSGRNAPDIELISSPLFQFNVDWWFRRKRVNPASYISVVIGSGSIKQFDNVPEHDIYQIDSKDKIIKLAKILHESRDSSLVHLCWAGITPDSDEWFWEAMGMLELYPDAVIVGGTLHDERHVLDGPRTFGFGDGCGCPDRGRSLTDPGYFAVLWKSRTVSAVSSGHCVVKADFLRDVIDELIQERVPLEYVGPWLGALAREREKRVLYSPFMRAFTNAVPEDIVSSDDLAHFLSRFWHLMPENRYLSPKLGLSENSAYVSVVGVERDLHLRNLQQKAMPYTTWIGLEIMRRIRRFPLPEKTPTFSILSTIYEGTNFAFLDLLADSIVSQTLGPIQWIIVAHGPIPGNVLDQLRDKSNSIWKATLIIEPRSLGIYGAMQIALRTANGQYILPVDSDDQLTLDALQIMAHEIVRLNYPEMIFSDEDLLVGDTCVAPFLRSQFDPVLNLDNSYIWHLCAIKRETALKLQLYSNPDTTWCLDWDNVSRIADSGGRIEHVKEILYHWRRHSDSTTNKPEGDPRSLASVRNHLENQISKKGLKLDDYSVEEWPVNRHTKELYIARRSGNLPPLVWKDEFRSGREHENPDMKAAILVITTGDITIDDDDAVFNEVARLFALHPQVAAIGGRVIDPNGRVVDGCWVLDQNGNFENPWLMRHIDDLGPYALLGKPHKVLATGTSMAFFRIESLNETKILPPGESTWKSWIVSTCNQIVQQGLWIAYSPLVIGRSLKTIPSLESMRSFPGPLADKDINLLTRYGRSAPYNPSWTGSISVKRVRSR